MVWNPLGKGNKEYGVNARGNTRVRTPTGKATGHAAGKRKGNPGDPGFKPDELAPLKKEAKYAEGTAKGIKARERLAAMRMHAAQKAPGRFVAGMLPQRSPGILKKILFAFLFIVVGLIEAFLSSFWWLALALLALIGIFNLFSIFWLRKLVLGVIPLGLAILSFESLVPWIAPGSILRYIILAVLVIASFFLVIHRDEAGGRLAGKFGLKKVIAFLVVFVLAIWEAGLFGSGLSFVSMGLLNLTLAILGLFYLFKSQGGWLMKTFGVLALVLAVFGMLIFFDIFSSLLGGFLGAGAAFRYLLILVVLLYILFKRNIAQQYGVLNQFMGQA